LLLVGSIGRSVPGPHNYNGELGHQGRYGAECSQDRREDRAYRGHSDRNFNKCVAVFIPDDDPPHVAFVNEGFDLIDEIASENLYFFDKIL
jgi:hypothetical protein